MRLEFVGIGWAKEHVRGLSGLGGLCPRTRPLHQQRELFVLFEYLRACCLLSVGSMDDPDVEWR